MIKRITELSDIPETIEENLPTSPDQIMLLDIETTGFHADRSDLYLIGCGYYERGSWLVTQFFAETGDDQEELLRAFSDIADRKTLLIHYNGNRFDVPYLKHKYEAFGLRDPLDRLTGFDVYKRLNLYSGFLKLPDMKLRTVMSYMGIDRNDSGGGELVRVYGDYLMDHKEEQLEELLLHNLLDISGLLKVFPLLSVSDLFDKPVKAVKARIERASVPGSDSKHELMLKLRLPSHIPVSINTMAKGCYFGCRGNEGILRVPILEGELKYFYADYRNYYYFPQEDQAIHKSVSAFSDSSFREQAKASNCYTRKLGIYLPEYSDEFTPFFKKTYDTNELYLEFTDERKTDRSFCSSYAHHILRMMAS